MSGIRSASLRGALFVLAARKKYVVRHGRACPGHPRLARGADAKTWIPGTRPGMTLNAGPRPARLHQPAPHGRERRLGAARDVELVIDHLDVARDGLRLESHLGG